MSEVKPQYRKVKDYIVDRIADGDWPPDSRVPSEHELLTQFGVARMTVTRALRELAAAGVVRRVQGVGTFVAGRKSDATMFDVRSIREEIEARGQEHSLRLLSSETVSASKPISKHFDLPAGTKLFHSRVLHLANDVPLQLEDRFVNPDLAPAYLEIDFEREIPHGYLMRVAPLQRSEHVIEADVAGKRLAATLALEPGFPVLVLKRRTWSRNQVASYVCLTHPASKYRFVGTFEFGHATT